MATRAQQIPELTGPFFDGDGTQISVPYAKFYIGGGAGSANTKNAYADASKSVSFTKIALSSEGNDIYGDGIYDIEVYDGDPDASGTIAYTVTYRKYIATLGNVRTITSDTDGNIDDSIVLVDTTSGDVDYTLPDPAEFIGRQLSLVKISSDSNTMSVLPNDAETINGATSFSKSSQFTAITVNTNGTDWYDAGDASTLGGVKASVFLPQSTTITPSSDADVTLTTAQLAYGRFVLADGSWTSAHNIIVPVTERRYYIDNSSGTYAATIKTSGGSGVEVPPGGIFIVVCDGTNVEIGASGRATQSDVDTGTNDVRFVTSLTLEQKYNPTVTGTATFTNSTNNIALTNIGAIPGLEVGDVIAPSGSASNDTEYTVEVITDDDNVIVNQAHAGGSTSKSLTDETVSVTVKLLAKWYNAPIGIGQGWVDVTASRALNTEYTNPIKRAIKFLSSSAIIGGSGTEQVIIDGTAFAFQTTASNNQNHIIEITVPGNSTYEIDSEDLSQWSELR